MKTRPEGGVREFDASIVVQSVNRCDLFLSLIPWHSQSVTTLLRLLTPKVTVGFFSEFDIALPRDYTKHSSELAFDVPRLLKPLLNLDDFAAPTTLSSTLRHRAWQILKFIPKRHKVLIAHADTLPEKMWHARRFSNVIDDFLERHRNYTVLVVGFQPLPIDKGKQPNRVIPTYGLPLEDQFALVAHADLFLGVDSCMLHAADFYRVPGVGLFGPSDPAEFGYRFTPHRHVRGDGTVQSISEAEVVSALESLHQEVCRQASLPRRFSIRYKRVSNPPCK
jgi:hypothetical protein